MYTNYEKSESQASPVELYRFSSTGFATSYFYASGDTDIEYNGDVYEAINIRRSQPELSREATAQALTIQMPRNMSLVANYIGFSPPKTVWLTIYRYHGTDPDVEVVVFWQGKVRKVSWKDNEAEITCQLIDSAFNRMGLRRLYGSTCYHMLYDNGCKLNANDFKYEAILTSINNDILSAQEFANFPGPSPVPDGYWITGFVERISNGDMRYVIAHSGQNITLLSAFETLAVGEHVLIYVGCDHAFSTCENKFNNLVNFGGFPYIPLQNPHSLKLI